MAKLSEKSSEKVMDVAEASLLMREIERPMPVKAILGTIAEMTGWTANRVRDVWHADPRVRLDTTEAQQLRAAAAQARREAAGAREARELKAKLARYEALLREARPDIDLSRLDLGGDAPVRPSDLDR